MKPRDTSLEIFKYTTDIFSQFTDLDSFVICGGSARDTYYDIPFKDIDIFVNGEGFDSFDFDILMQSFKDTGNYINNGSIQPSFGKTDENTSQYGRTIEAVEKLMHRYRGYQLDIVCVTLDNGAEFTPENLVATFDYNLVQAWYDPITHEIAHTEAFLDGVVNGPKPLHDPVSDSTKERMDRWMARGAHAKSPPKRKTPPLFSYSPGISTNKYSTSIDELFNGLATVPRYANAYTLADANHPIVLDAELNDFVVGRDVE